MAATRAGRRFGALGGVVVGLAAALVTVAPPAEAFVFVSPSISFPSSAVVGQTFAASVGIGNNSTPPDSTTFPSLRVSNIDVNPACGTETPSPRCSNAVAEQDFSLAATGTATGGPASCNGTWTIAESVAGRFRFTPPGGNASLVLATGETCVVNFTATSLKVPNVDASVVAGVQTAQLVTVDLADAANAGTTFPSTTGVDETTVNPATPGFTTAASTTPPQAATPPPIPVTSSDSATLSAPAPPSSGAGVPPTGTITFNLYGPSASTCSGAAAFTSTVPVNGFGSYTTASPATISQPGTWRWVAAYSGDANYASVFGACDTTSENVTVAQARPSITTTATSAAFRGLAVKDAASLSGGFNPTGTITFQLFGATDTSCQSAAVFTSTVAVSGNGQYSSNNFTPAQSGTYRWIASYSGDVNNAPAQGACNDAGESSVVGGRRAPADFDGDGKSDVTVFRGKNGVWYENRSGGGQVTVAFGVSGDIPQVGDYDGDGLADVAVFRFSTGVWYVNPTAGPVTSTAWGVNGDIPVAGDYDGDGKTDLAVFRPSTGVWYVDYSSGGSSSTAWGTDGDFPVVGDFDGDGKADLAVFRANPGVFYVKLSGGGSLAVSWGTTGDQPVAGDYDGDGKADVAVFRPSTGQWFVERSTGGSSVTAWGTSDDQSVAGDYDGDGKTDFAVFRFSTGQWFVNGSGGASSALNWGTLGDITVPTPGD